MEKLNHIDENGKAKMVDVGDKTQTLRMCVAKGKIRMNEQTLEKIIQNEIEKGDVLTTAKIAGIMGAKKTSELIPMCHNILIDCVDVKFNILNKTEIECVATSKTFGKTGIEMESMTCVAIALLTIYDMCKAVDRRMEIGEISLVKKSGGKHDFDALEEEK